LIRLLAFEEVGSRKSRSLAFLSVVELGDSYFCKLAGPWTEISWDSWVEQIVAF